MNDEILSPCINICTTDPDSGYCLGCSRTPEEIEKWGNPNTCLLYTSPSPRDRG